MNHKRTFMRWIAGLIGVWLVISSCGLLNNTTSIGETRTETQTVEPGSAHQARVQIKMRAGELSVAGEATSLMEANFRYNVADLQPRVNYIVDGDRGELVIDHPGVNIPLNSSLINEWDLFFSNALPLDLDIETNAGDSDLDLRGLDLSGLRVQTDAGTAILDLSGTLDHDLRATIRGGIGELSVKLPGEMGVRVEVDTAIGGLNISNLVKDGDVYVNSVYGSAAYTLYLDIETGVGSITLLAP